MTCTDDQDVVELVDSVNLGEQLVDHGVMDGRTASHRASRLTDGVYLIKDDDVEATVWSHLDNMAQGIRHMSIAPTQSAANLFYSFTVVCENENLCGELNKINNSI